MGEMLNMTKEDIESCVYHLAVALMPEYGEGMRTIHIKQAWRCFGCILYGHGAK